MLLRILDIIAAIMIVVSLWNVPKNRKWWLVYAIGTVPFLYVTICKGLIGLTIMGVVLLCTGVKNYLREGKNKLKGVDSKYLWEIIEDLYDDDPCELNHQGYCTTHDWFNNIQDCPHKRIQVIKSLPRCREIMKGMKDD